MVTCRGIGILSVRHQQLENVVGGGRLTTRAGNIHTWWARDQGVSRSGSGSAPHENVNDPYYRYFPDRLAQTGHIYDIQLPLEFRVGGPYLPREIMGASDPNPQPEMNHTVAGSASILLLLSRDYRSTGFYLSFHYQRTVEFDVTFYARI